MNVETKIELILSGILGNRTVCNRILESLQRITGASLSPIWLSDDDYLLHRAPFLLRRFSTLETAHVTHRKLAHLHAPDPNIVFVNGYELAMAAHRRFPRARLVVALDATPALIRRIHGLTGESPARRLIKYPLTRIQHEQFRRCARHVWRWLPMSRHCSESLVQDYGIDPQASYIMRAPQTSIATTLGRMRAPQDRFRLLFVGNDFHRKGGPALLQAVSNEFTERCDLTIVSNDPVVEASALPANVKLLRGTVDPKELSAVYNEHDLLVLPTRYDIYPNVLCEALAQATPFLATRLPGIEELAVESGAGWMLPVSATAAQISDAIRALIDDPQKLARARERALSYAQLYLATALLDRKLQEILETQ